MIECNYTVERLTESKLYSFNEICGNTAKYKVEYNEATRGNRLTEIVCGVHKNSIIAMCKRINRMAQRDFTEINIIEL